MKLTYVKNVELPSSKQILEFRGYNESVVIADGEMRDMKNLSSDEYPCLYQRKQRHVYSSIYINPSNIVARKEKIVVIDGTEFYYDGAKRGTVLAGEKQIAAINSKICIFPDKKYYDVVSNEFGDLSNSQTIVTTTDVYIKVRNNALMLTGDTFTGFKSGDAVDITGFETKASNNLTAVIGEVTSTMLQFGKDTFTVNEDSEEYQETGTIVINRKMPEIDFVVEYNNRLWGCAGNSIYSSKLGDPTNWNYFKGLSQDSYAVDVGTDGDFTGCAACGTHLVFFKEDYIHKLYGSKPSNYQISDMQCQGLQTGCEKSLCLIDGVLFYKSRHGIMAYNSGVPELISDNFGDIKYFLAAAGTDGNKYYVSMKEDSNKWHMFVYDIRKRFWHKEDNTHVQQFAYCDGVLYFIDADTKKIMTTTDGTNEKIEWSATLGDFTEYSESKRIYSKVKMRLHLEELSELHVFISVDGEEFKQIANIYSEIKRTLILPIVPVRCDRFSIKLVGKGYCKIESLVREYRIRSDI